jgi:hypothetical protein
MFLIVMFDFDSFVSMKHVQIKIWFQNRRAKDRKLKKKRHDALARSSFAQQADSSDETGMDSPLNYSDLV